MEAVIDSEGALSGTPDDILTILDASLAQSTEEFKRSQEEYEGRRERVKQARDTIWNIDTGRRGEYAILSQAKVRLARVAFWDRLSELVVNPNTETLSQARLALCGWQLAKQLVVTLISTEQEDSREYVITENWVAARPLQFRVESVPNNHPKPMCPRKAERLAEKRTRIEQRRRAIEVALVRSRGTKQALDDSLAGNYSWGIELDDDEYNEAVADFAKPPRKMNPKYFARNKVEAETDLTFASRKVKVAKKAKDDGKKKGKGKPKRSQMSLTEKDTIDKRRR